MCPVGDGVDVEPAGDAIAGDLSSGAHAVFTAGSVSVTCSTSHTSGTIPATDNPADPVTGVLAPPSFTSCSSNIGFAATTTTNSTNGSWGLDISCGGNATLHIPKAGAVTRVATCTITVAPSAAVDIPATYTNGSPGVLSISASVPVSHSGFGCPNVTTATFSATSNITDTTHPTQNLLFPHGERFFVRSVKRFLDRIEDPVLRAQIKGFFGQEGRHAHAHDRVNAVLRSQGFEIDRFLGRYQRIASWVEAHTPAKLNLAVTAAMEHFTAILAEGAFKYSVLDQAAPEMRRLHQLAATWMAARGIALLGQSYDAA